MSDGRWWLRGVCRDLDTELFFSHEPDDIARAKAVCSWCPVHAECLADALADPSRRGVWGGMSERDRSRLRRKARGTAA